MIIADTRDEHRFGATESVFLTPWQGVIFPFQAETSMRITIGPMELPKLRYGQEPKRTMGMGGPE